MTFATAVSCGFTGGICPIRALPGTISGRSAARLAAALLLLSWEGNSQACAAWKHSAKKARTLMWISLDNI